MADVTGGDVIRAVPRPLSGLQKPLTIALVISMAGDAGIAVMSLLEYSYRTAQGIDPFLVDGGEYLAFAIVYLLATLAQIGGFIAGAILMLRWTFRAIKNLHLVNAPGVTMSPGWAAGWYFIPFANLWKPFEGFLQIWRASHNLAGQPEKVASYVGWWWGTWIGSTLLSNIAMRLSGLLEEAPTYNEGLIVGAIATAMSVPCAWFMMRATRQVTQTQAAMQRGGLADTFA